MPHDPERLAGVVVRHVADYVQRELAPMLQRLSALEARAPEPGRDGRDGRDGKDGEKGLDGAPGKDGLGFEDLSVAFDGERTITFKFERDDLHKEFPVTAPWHLDRGVWREGQSYQRGDAVSFGGSLWIAQEETSEKPDGGKGWRLAVKRGRDGKDRVTTNGN